MAHAAEPAYEEHSQPGIRWAKTWIRTWRSEDDREVNEKRLVIAGNTSLF